MSIAPVSTNSIIILKPLSENNVIKLLEKQKMQLQEQIQKINESKLDDKIKQDRIKQLQDQIQQIDMEIQQRQTEKLNQKQNKSTNRQAAISQSNGTDNEYSGNLAGMSDLIKASSTYSQAKIMNSTKNSLSGKGRILKKEIELDESRSLSGSKVVSKRQELEKIESREKILDKKVAEANQTANNQVKEASKRVNKDEVNKDFKNSTIDSNRKTQNAKSASNIEKKNSQQQEPKGTEQIYKRVDIKI